MKVKYQKILLKLSGEVFGGIQKYGIDPQVLDVIAEEIKNLQDKMSIEELENYAEKKFGIDKETLEFIQENLNVVREVDYKPKIIDLIESLDEGEGVEIRKLLELSNLPENLIENAINDLLASGVLFEPRPGILKKV